MISVIMPTYNRARVIEKAIHSVLNQSYKDLELIIVDDGSTDGTQEAVGNLTDQRIRYIRCDENRGHSHARNMGIDAAKGEYIAFLDSDNVWVENHLKRRVDMLEGSEKPALVFGNVEMLEEGVSRHIFPSGLRAEDAMDRAALIRLMCMGNQMDTNAVALSRECMACYRFDESMNALVDWDLFLRIILDPKYEVFFDPEITVRHYLSSDSVSRKKELYLRNRLMICAKHRLILDGDMLAPDIGFLRGLSDTELMKSVEEVPESLWPILIKYLAQIMIKMNIYLTNTETSLDNALRNWKAYHTIVDIEASLEEKQIGTLAIYGYGNFGKRLYRQLEGSRLAVKYVIDRSFEDGTEGGMIRRSCVDNAIPVDAILVSILNDTEELIAGLRAQTDTPVYSILELRTEL